MGPSETYPMLTRLRTFSNVQCSTENSFVTSRAIGRISSPPRISSGGRVRARLRSAI
jgi:hypothetical protein